MPYLVLALWLCCRVPRSIPATQQRHSLLLPPLLPGTTNCPIVLESRTCPLSRPPSPTAFPSTPHTSCRAARPLFASKHNYLPPHLLTSTSPPFTRMEPPVTIHEANSDKRVAEACIDTSSKSSAPALLENGQPVNGEPNHDAQEIQNSQDTHENTASTPPTSDGFEAINHAASLVEDALSTQSQETQLLQLSDVAAAQMPLSIDGNAPSYVVAPSAGQKRTASGMVKSAKSPTSPVTENSAGHTRSVSNISTSSNASSGLKELSAELKARLSYAMLKVNNGWQSHSIDEVESLASQAVSPTSSTSTRHGRKARITSPRTTIASRQSENRTAQNFSSSAPVLGASDSLSSPTTADQPSSQPGRTYESFWREHSANANPTHRSSPFHPNSSLALPVDFNPIPNPPSVRNPTLNHPGRSDGHSRPFRPPMMPLHTVSDLSQSSIAFPHTPTRDPALNNMLRTPSQKSIQEQDAIESLLFMSSPGNPGNMMHAFPPPAPPSNQQSPLRSEVNTTASTLPPRSQPHKNTGNVKHAVSRERSKKVGFSRGAEEEGEDSSEGGGYSLSRASSNKSSIRPKSRYGDADDMDMMLDDLARRAEMGSSDDEMVELVTSTPRRRVIGRM